MGMGDRQEPYKPKYAPVRCDVTGKMFSPISVRDCLEPHVIRRYGIGGKCKVSVLICKKCRYGYKARMIDGWGCFYELEKRLQAGA